MAERLTTEEAEHGMILRTAHARTVDRVYYTLPGTSAGKNWEARVAHYIKQLRGRLARLDSREQQMLERLESGWLPMWRYRRYSDADGERAEARELCVAPPDYRWKVVKRKPGWA